jgi:D-glycero-D-manno-heptose 1,7-bisphosphate phosphatase
MSLRKLLGDEEFNPGDLSRFSVGGKTNFNPKPVIGIARDGIINQFKPNHVKTPDDFDPIPDALKAIALIRSKGYRIVIFASQWGISEGRLTQVDVDLVHQKMLQLFGEAGCSSIEGIYYSTSKMKEDIYAFPNTGMFERAEKEARVKFKEGWFVGHTIAEIKAAQNIKAKPILITTGEGLETEKKLNSYANRDLKQKTKVFSTLLEFAESLE